MSLFSVLIPTRNRAALLREAITSVLRQSCSDYEIIVSDNASSDNTSAVVAGFNNPRIHYFRSDKFLPAQENWYRAYQQAKGEYILFVGDDDYLLPEALSDSKKLIEQNESKIISWGIVTYYDKTFIESNLRDTIHGEKFTGKTFSVSAKKVIPTFFQIGSGSNYQPHPSAFVIKHQLLKQIIKDWESCPLIPYPEIIIELVSVAMAGLLWIINKPLTIVGRGCSSQVALEVHQPEIMWSNLITDFSHTLFKGNYSYNAYTESVLRAKQYFPELFSGYELSLDGYCVVYYQNMIRVAMAGNDIGKDLEEFWNKISELPVAMRQKIYSILRWGTVKWRIKKTPVLGRIVIRIKRLLRKHFYGKLIVSGKQFGVNNIADCASKLPEIAERFGWINYEDLQGINYEKIQ